MAGFSHRDHETLLRLEALIQAHGESVYWWNTSDSPNMGCYGIRLDMAFWLVMSPQFKGDAGLFITIVPDSLVGPDD